MHVIRGRWNKKLIRFPRVMKFYSFLFKHTHTTYLNSILGKTESHRSVWRSFRAVHSGWQKLFSAQHAANGAFGILSHTWEGHLYSISAVTPGPPQKMGQKDCRSRGGFLEQCLWTWQDHSTLELSASVVAHIRPAHALYPRIYEQQRLDSMG